MSKQVLPISAIAYTGSILCGARDVAAVLSDQQGR